MRRIWILVPFWAFFVAYLVSFSHRRHPAVSAPATNHSDKPAPADPLAAPVPHLPGTSSFPSGGATPPSRVRESLPAALSESDLDARIAATASSLFVLPRTVPASPVSFLWPVDADGSPDQPTLLAKASRASFPRWKLYDDEWVGFYYPDDPTITLEILDGAAAFPMIGETMWTVADAPERRYRLVDTVGGATLCMISLEKSGVFDDTPRYPKPEVFHRVWTREGSLWRASLMADGNLRRIEILAGGDRASVLDWPHCAMHREVYQRLALSVRLNGPVADGPMLFDAVLASSDGCGRLGFLAPGMESAAVSALLGAPVAWEGDVAVFRQSPAIPLATGIVAHEAEVLYRVPLAGGRFEGFAKGWRSRRRTPPETGSLAWMVEKTGGTSGDEGTVGYDLGPLTDEEVLAMFDRFCAEAQGANAEGWDTWCRILANLAEMGSRDDRVLPYIGARFLDPALPQGNATQLLHSYDPAAGRDLFAARLRFLLTLPEDAPAVSVMAHDLQVLFAYMGREDVRTVPLLDLAMRHPDGDVREAGYGFREWLPEARAAAFLEHGLEDPNVRVRRRCAEALCGDGNPANGLLELVARRLASEDDSQTRIYLEEVCRLHKGDATDAAQIPAGGVSVSGDASS